MRAQYVEAIEQWRTSLKLSFEGKVNYVPVCTDESLENVMYGWLREHRA